jgi:uncharacterized protein (DUF1800 family)
MNFALQLASNNLRGGDRAPLAAGRRNVPIGDPVKPSSDIVETVLNNDVSKTTRDTIAQAKTPQQMLALTLGSPEFQRR